ncbi:HNH endonuclease [Nocardia amikacinitolerans]|uniref:HNH endonuclease n=1 Tax=Nocardia amikacinitolerans TaxID=756689 RepID=A0A285LGR6_9NOCA|nr:HNH endonuclease [Nocardia amikacinitolerans]
MSRWGSGRTSTSAHRRWARAVLQRDEYRCQQCGYQGRAGAGDVEADHITPVYCGGKTILDNGQTLCKPHHDAKSEAERLAALRDRHQRGRRPPETHPGQQPRRNTLGG